MTKRKFGIELEVGNEYTPEQIKNMIAQVSKKNVIATTNWQNTENNSFYHVKWDSTCGPKGKHKDNGWEIATFVASGYKDLLEIQQVVRHIKSKLHVNNNCGLHIHVDVSDFNTSQMGILLAHWFKIEGWIYEMLPMHRFSNIYCQPLSLKYQKVTLAKKYTGGEFWEIVRPHNYQLHENHDKRVAFNTVSYLRYLATGGGRATVELRAPEGTLDPEIVVGWARFMVNFVSTIKKRKMPSNLFTALDVDEFFVMSGLDKADEFSVLSPGLFKTKIWMLKRLIQFSRSNLVKTLAQKKLDYYDK